MKDYIKSQIISSKYVNFTADLDRNLSFVSLSSLWTTHLIIYGHHAHVQVGDMLMGSTEAGMALNSLKHVLSL